MTLQDHHGIVSQLHSEFELESLLNFELDGLKGVSALRSGDDEDARAARASVIEAVRAGKHVELKVDANTFRQTKGKQNRRYLKLNLDGDATARVGTFRNQPFLVDHNTWEQSARKGTIQESTLVQETRDRVAFRQTLRATKPDAVISLLDGTIDRFSIGWFPGAVVLCTAHKVNVLSRDSCGCWPGEKVELDGVTKIVEYEFLEWTGKEVSGVNIPAVPQTDVQQVRAALAAELRIPGRRTIVPVKEKEHMSLIKLAAALSLTALGDSPGDEDRAVAAVESLRARALSAEAQVAALGLEKAQLQAALDTSLAAGQLVQINARIERAYREGKLKYGRDESGNPIPSARENRLRRIGAGKNGLEELDAELADMPVVVPVGVRQSEGVLDPPRENVLGEEGFGNPYLSTVAERLGLKLEDMEAFRDGHLMEGV